MNPCYEAQMIIVTPLFIAQTPPIAYRTMRYFIWIGGKGRCVHRFDEPALNEAIVCFEVGERVCFNLKGLFRAVTRHHDMKFRRWSFLYLFQQIRIKAKMNDCGGFGIPR